VRICISDYSGHPFQIQLSRELACRGHDVLHLHFMEFQTPKGRLQLKTNDPPSLAIEAISLGQPFAKYAYIKRRYQEIEVGRRFASRIAAFAPDLVVGCNLPIDALAKVSGSCRRKNLPFIFWQQDIYSAAIRKILKRKLGFLGQCVGHWYQLLERRAATNSAAVITIADDFRYVLEKEFRVPSTNIHVIENWAPLDEITPRAKDNFWARSHGLADRQVILYTGTLGLKHDPRQILALAEALRERPKTSIVVVSEGPAAAWLFERKAFLKLENLTLLPFQGIDVYADVLGSADILVSLLEADAGNFSVPSKVLSYMCAERAIVLSAPPNNLASRLIERSGSGIVVPAGDADRFIKATVSLLNDSNFRAQCARRARQYAEVSFNIGAICDRFESIFYFAKKGHHLTKVPAFGAVSETAGVISNNVTRKSPTST